MIEDKNYYRNVQMSFHDMWQVYQFVHDMPDCEVLSKSLLRSMRAAIDSDIKAIDKGVADRKAETKMMDDLMVRTAEEEEKYKDEAPFS